VSILAQITSWWSSFYGNHQIVSLVIRYLHLAGIVLAAGTALFADRQVWRALRSGPPERESVLALLTGAHPRVVPGLVVIGATGVLMTAAETSTFLASRIYWIKLALVALLMVNGLVMLAAERRARRAGAGWSRLAAISTISAALWLVILFLGKLLTVAA